MKTLHTIYTNFAKQNLASLRLLLVMLLTLNVTANAWGEEVKYTVSSTSAVTVSGKAPTGSSADYSSTYSTKCQLTKNNSMTLTLSGYDGCKISGLTLSMKSNSGGGAGNMSMKIGSTTAASISTAKFNTSSWHGLWSTSYVDVTPSVTAAIVGNGEKIVITIAATENSLYCQSFTLTYEPSSSGGDTGDACGWVETELDDVQSSDVIIITMTNSTGTTYAMSNNNGTSNPPFAVKVTVSGKTLLETDDDKIADNIKWNVGGSNDAYIFYPNGDTQKWLYATSTNNGVRVGTNTNKTFKIHATSGYLFHNETSRYIGVYNSQDWRCYTTMHDNIKNQTLKFYKYVPCGPTETTITLYPNNGTPNENQEITTEEESYALPECPFSRTGYTFAGWATSADGSVVYEDKATIDDLNGTEVNLYAQWEPIQYAITYELNGGTNHQSNPKTYTIETSTFTLQNPTKKGHTFKGWYSESSYTHQITTIEKGSTGDITLYAKWEVDTYKITLDANGGVFTKNGNTSEKIEVDYVYGTYPTYDDAQLIVDYLSENNITLEKRGYNLKEIWTSSGTPWKRIYTETDNRTIIAQWEEKQLINFRTLCTYNIVYTNLEGTTHTNPVTYTAADLPLTFTEAPSAREGYTFAGWNPATLSAETRGDQIVTAQWQVNSHTLTWKVNGGDALTGEYTTGSVEYGTTIIPPAKPTRTGYTFAGWGAEVAQTMPDHDLVYTAQWTVNTYTITLDQQGATTQGTTTVVATYGSALPSIAENLPTKTGYDFGGYYTEINGNGTQYYHGTGTGARNWDIASETTLYACWKPNTCTLIFNMNGGVGDQPNLTATYDQPMPALTAPLPTLSGYEFSGYFDKKTGGVMYYNAAGESARNLDKTNGEKTLYAQWAAIHTVTWMVNGSLAEGDPTTSVVNGQTITTLPTTPDVDCNGKVFVGWTTATIHGETPDKPSLLYKELSDFPAVTSNMTFYAVFANGSGDERWVETEINDIEATDEVVVMMAHGKNLYALPYDKETASNSNPVATPITLDDFEGRIDDELIWFITKDHESNNFTLSPKTATDKYLTCNSTNNAVRINTGENRNFTIENDFLKNTAFRTYLAISTMADIPDWRHFASTNTTIVNRFQTLKFYKKTTVYTSYTNYSTSCVAGEFDITNIDPIYVTSAVGQKIKATEKLVLTTTDMAVGSEISLSAPNITFYKEGVEITQLTTSAASETFELEIAYQPTIANTTEQPTITLDILGYKFTIDNKITARSLPETFAIVAKVGNVWYALPSQGLNSTTPPVAYPVEVDNMADPTAVTAVPENADWSLRQVYASSGSNDRFTANGDNLVFVNNASPAMTLNASSSEEENYLLADAQYNNYYSTNPGLYEWTPTTTDRETYQLTNEQRSRKLSVNIATVFGVHAQNKAVEHVRFLPITGRYTPAALQVVEWNENSVVIMYNGNPAQTASVSVNGGEAQNTTLSSAQRDTAVYELTATGLAANPTQRLSITIGSEKTILSIPYIINSETTDAAILPDGTVAALQEVAKVSDLVILKGATLTAAGAKGNPYKFRNVTVYGGGKLVVPADNGFGVNSLTLRIGGVTADGNYDYVYPEFVLNTNTKDAYTNTSGKINLDYLTTKEQYYTFVAPFAVETKDIKYPVDIYGSNVKAANRGSFEFQYYDGEARANGEKGWKVVEEDPTDGAILTAHKGYTFYGMPKKVSVNGGTSTRQKFGIHRIPMSVAASTAMSHENGAQTVAISAHPSEKNINSGWNLIGNPYMATITGLNNNSIQTGTIVLVDDRWQWSDAGSQASRFIVFPSNDGEWYYTSQATNAELPAFKNFFVQIGDKNATDLSIPRNTSQAQLLAPIRHTDEEVEHDIEMAIVLEKDEANSDQMDFLINDAYGAGFDYNADFTKMMNNTQLNLYGVLMEDNLSFVALDHYSARGSVAIGYQVPSAGEYTLRISDKPYVMLDRIEALYVTDHEMNPAVTTNLMEEDYVFHVGKAEINDTRFTISLTVETNTNGDDITTDMGELDIHSKQPQKFFYDSKLYILRDGKIYSATGHEIKTINE